MSHRPDLRIVPPPRDYAEPFAFVPSHNTSLTLGERLVNYFRHNGGRLIFGTACFTFGMLFADAIIYVLAVLS